MRGHPLISTKVNEVGHFMAVINKAVVNLEHNSVIVEKGENLKGSLYKFFSLDNVGSKCVGCLCTGCPTNGEYTIEEECELDLIERGLSYNEKEMNEGGCYLSMGKRLLIHGLETLVSYLTILMLLWLDLERQR